MRFGLAILLAVTAPAGASLAERAQLTLRGSKPDKKAASVSVVVKGAEELRKRTNAMGDTGRPDKDTYRAEKIAQKKAEREAKLAEKEDKHEATQALREAKKAETEAKKAELKADKAKQKAVKLAEKETNGKHNKEKSTLKKRLDDADNSTSIEEVKVEDGNSTMVLRTEEDGWMPTPSPIEAIEVLTPWPTEPHMTLICPDSFDPERSEPYKVGDQVTVDSSIFECQAGDYEKFCSIAELDIKRENKHAKKLWKEAWQYVSSCTVAEITNVDSTLETATDEALDEVLEVNATVEAETEDTSVIEIVDDEGAAVAAVEAETEDASVIEIADDEDAAVEADEIEGEVAADGAVDIDSLIQPRSAGLEQHNWDMGFDFAEEPCVSDVCNHQLSDICLLKYQVNVPEANEPTTITMELICEGVTWLGIGFSQDGLMAGSEAVIGVLGEEPQKYNLDGRWMGGVIPMKDSQQTLIDASINVYYGPITVLKFTKIMKEPGEIEIGSGDNTFLYAQGQSYFLGQHAHDSRGSFQLNLPSVGAPTTMDVERSFVVTAETSTSTVAPTTPVPDQPCTTEWCFEEIGTDCGLKYVVNYLVDEPSTITMDLTCEGENWIGLGFSLDGSMAGSEAVIAGAGQEPRKYNLGNKWFGSDGVVEMPEYQQTLIDASVRVKWVEGSNGLFPLMKMRFTKIMAELGEIQIRPGENLFLYAQGTTPSFPSYHIERGSFPLTLPSDGSSSGADTPTTVAPASQEMEVTELSPQCTLKHAVNVPAQSITMELICDSVGWVAVGFSTTGFMPQSEAVIGIPERNPEKYFLKKKRSDKIFRLPDEAQTLTDASLTVEDGETVMRFTKMLTEPNEIPITQGLHFLFAHGDDEKFGWHGPHNRGSVQLNLQL